MNMKRHFQIFALVGIITLSMNFVQAQSSQTRGGWGRALLSGRPAQTNQTTANSNSQLIDARPIIELPEPPTPSENGKKSIVGSWQLTVKIPDNPPPFDSFIALWALTSDGLMVGSAQGDATFPATSSAYGAWTQTAKNKFAVTFRLVQYDNNTGELLTTFKLNQSITLSDDGDTWDGPFKLTVSDPAGNVLAVVDGSAHATRIVVEPLN